jgi:hypothetical protein
MFTMSLEFINNAFAAVDSRISARFLELLTPGVSFIYANQAPAKGLEQVKGALDQFYGAVKSMQHDIVGAFQCENVGDISDRILIAGDILATSRLMRSTFVQRQRFQLSVRK